MTSSPFVFRFANKRLELFCLCSFVLWAFFLFYKYFPSPTVEWLILRQAVSPSAGISSNAPCHWASTLLFFLRVLCTAAAIGWTTLRLGFFLRNWLKLRPSNVLLQWSFDLGLGIMGVDFLWLGLGFNELWYGAFQKECFVLLFVVCVLEKIFHFSLPSLKSFEWPQWPYIFLALLGIVYWFFSLMHGFLPETHPDGLGYHLGTLWYWFMHHGIRNIPSYYGGYPYGGELFLWTGCLFQGTETAKLLNVFILGFCGLAAAGWALENAGRNAAYLAFGLVLILPLIELVSWSTQVETFMTLFSVLFFQGLCRFIQNKDFGSHGIPSVLLVGLWGGMALSTKYTALLTIGTGIGLWIFFIDRKKDWITQKNFVVMVAAVLLPFSIWLLKNWVYTGDPLAPYFEKIFDDSVALWWGNDGPDVNHRPLDWFRLLWTLPLSQPSLYGFTGPFFLTLLPVAFLFRARTQEWKWMGWTLAMSCPLCLGIFTILKFDLPTIIAFYVFCAVILGGQWNQGWMKVAIFFSLICSTLCIPYLVGMSSYYYSGWGIWSSRESSDQYLERRLPYYDSCRFVSEDIPKDSRLLLIGAQDLYYDRSCEADWSFLEKVFLDSQNLSQVSLKMREAGLTHILVNLSDIGDGNFFPNWNLTPNQWRLLDDYFRRGLDPVYEQGPTALYAVRPTLEPFGDPSRVDPFLFCSGPASRFVVAKRMGDLIQARSYLNECLKLYPFSDYWERQNIRLRSKRNISRL